MNNIILQGITLDELCDELMRRLKLHSNTDMEKAREAEDIISTAVLCKRLNITEQTAIRWRKKGKIPFFTIGSAVRYDWPKVIAALEKK